VSPLICQGTPVHTYIHCAGGRCGISVKEVDGRVERRLYEHIAKQKQLVSKVLPTLERKPTELAEFHCMLIRKSFLDQHGPLDPKVLNTREHIDFCIAVMQKGGEIWLEPSSIVTYLHDTSVQFSDWAFFMYRWSDQSERSSLLYLRDKWDLTSDHTFQQRLKNVGWRQRMHVIRPYIKSLKSGIGQGKPGKWLEEGVVRADRVLNRLLFVWNERKPMPDGGEATRYG
jgi:GT2 family glycosyltransferase